MDSIRTHTRSTPRPPARVDIKKMNVSLSALLYSFMLSCLADSDVCPSMLPNTNGHGVDQTKFRPPYYHRPKCIEHWKIQEPYRAYLYPRSQRKSSRISSIMVICEKISTRFPLFLSFGSNCTSTIFTIYYSPQSWKFSTSSDGVQDGEPYEAVETSLMQPREKGKHLRLFVWLPVLEIETEKYSHEISLFLTTYKANITSIPKEQLHAMHKSSQ